MLELASAFQVCDVVTISLARTMFAHSQPELIIWQSASRAPLSFHLWLDLCPIGLLPIIKLLF